MYPKVRIVTADDAWLTVTVRERNYTRRRAGTCPQRWELTDKRTEKGEQEAKPQRIWCNFLRGSPSQIAA